MSVVVTVMNMKGGVGKTTVALHLAGVAARFRWNGNAPLPRVLAIDYDPQFNMSQALLTPKDYFALEKSRKTTLSVLLEDDADLDPYQLQVPGNRTPPAPDKVVTRIYQARTTRACLDLLPSTLDLMYVALGPANTDTSPIEERFAKFIDTCRKLYDLIIIDCHPAGSLFTKTSLSNSDHVLIPVMPQRYAVRGIGLMEKFIAAKRTGKTTPQYHILFNATSRTNTSIEEDAIRKDKDFAPHCLTNTLKRYKAFSEPEGGQGFVWASGKPYSTEAFRNLLIVADEFQTRIGV